jgi:hypothetical protein
VNEPLALEPIKAPRAGGRVRVKSMGDLVPADPATPLHASVVDVGGALRAVFHQATSSAPLGEGTFVVAANTGLWLHDTQTMERRARLAPGPILDVAASPDGARIAFVAGGTDLRVVSYPALATLVRARVDEPCRMRFSDDGARLALASQRDTVTLVDIGSGKVTVHDTGEDVNDVFPMPDPDEVAYASDDDDFAIVDVSVGRKVWSSTSYFDRYLSAHPFMTRRDQLAVAFDPVTGTLLGGGDDNKLWRAVDARGPSKKPVIAPVELDSNVVEIGCCTGKTKADRRAFVALDNVSVRAVDLASGRLGPRFGPLHDNVGSYEIRMALLPSGDVLVTTWGNLLRWEPKSGMSAVSHDYRKALAESASRSDLVFVVPGRGRFAVHRMPLSAPAADVETSVVGTIEIAGLPKVLVFGDETRVIAGHHKGHLRLVYLPSGGALEAPIDTPAGVDHLALNASFAERDAETHGYVDPAGNVYEISLNPRGARLVGKATGTAEITGLDWMAGPGRWRVRRGEVEALVP